MHIMDGERVTKPKDIRRRHTDAFKQALVERSLVPGASVAAIAQDAGINANLLFNWRRLHLQAAASTAAEDSRGPVLLPVTVVEPGLASLPPPPVAPTPAPAARAPAGSIEINVRGAVVRVRGNVDEASLRTVLRALAGTA
jgi:transposase